MSIYRTASKESFLKLISDFIIHNFQNKLADVKIILPSSYVCNDLQKIILEKIGSAILPQIAPISNIGLEGEEAFKIPANQIGVVSAIEERIILATIISSYGKLDYNFSQSLKLAPSLAKLFFEFEINDIKIDTLRSIPILDQPEHWYAIHDFLEFAYINWQNKITEVKKLSSAQYQKIAVNAEISNSNNFNAMIIAGVIGNNKLIQNFITKIAKLKNGHVILPPAINKNIELRDFSPEDALYNFAKLLNNINIKMMAIKPLETLSHNILDNLLLDNFCPHHTKHNISYFKFDNILLEAEYIAIQCHELLNKKPEAKIAILINDLQTVNYFTAKLTKYNLTFHEFIGQNILQQNFTSLILEILNNICTEFSVRNFVSLISHPLVINNECLKLKKIIAQKNRFTRNIEEISQIISEISSSEPQNQNWQKLVDLCNQLKLKAYNFSKILKKAILIANTLCPKIYSDKNNIKIAQSFADILNVNLSKIFIDQDNVESIPELVKSLLSGGVIFNNTYNPKDNIFIANPNDVTLINYDLLIHTNFIENSYPSPQINNPWLNRQMIESLELESWYTKSGNALYDFYLNLQNKQIIITSSNKDINAQITRPSPFIFRLKHATSKYPEIFQESYISNKPFTKFKLDKNSRNLQSAKSSFFPNKISATDIELLIRSPYNFYVKKILKLRKTQEIEEHPNLSEFGNIFHKIIELYTKDRNKNTNVDFKNHAKKILQTSIFPQQAKEFWQYKIESLASEFVNFENNRRLKTIKIFTEIAGKIQLKIDNEVIQITAIADRIELMQNGKIAILDYKTGAIPTKQEVISGLSPQLIIEAIIAIEGGFPGIEKNIAIENIIYIKINSQAPFISQTEIKLTKEELIKHKEGLIKLLKHYINLGEYPIDQNLVKYDDYIHLARRI